MIKKIFKVKIWPISHLNDSETQEGWLKTVKIQTIIFKGVSCPLIPLEACAFGTHLGNWPVFILHLYLNHEYILLQQKEALSLSTTRYHNVSMKVNIFNYYVLCSSVYPGCHFFFIVFDLHVSSDNLSCSVENFMYM